MDTNKFEYLIKQTESKSLDFKKKFYTFTPKASSGVARAEDSEFIKDILSFHNTVREGTSYIIFGIEEDGNTGQKTTHGIIQTIDEAVLQNKIKDKVSPIPEFSFSIFSYQGQDYGIIEIPLPNYPKPSVPIKNWGKLEKGKVYFRRGSSNSEADADETFKIYNWFNDLSSISRKKVKDEEELTEFIDEVIQDEKIFKLAKSIILERALELGIGNKECKLLIEQRKKVLEKKSFKSFFPLNQFLLPIGAVVLFFGIYLWNTLPEEFQAIEKVDKLIFERNFKEAMFVLKNSSDLLSGYKSQQLERKIIELEIEELIQSGNLVDGMKSLAFYRIFNFKPNYNIKQEDITVSGVDGYNNEVNWFNGQSTVLFNHFLINGDFKNAKKVNELLTYPIATIVNDDVIFKFNFKEEKNEKIKSLESIFKDNPIVDTINVFSNPIIPKTKWVEN